MGRSAQVRLAALAMVMVGVGAALAPAICGAEGGETPTVVKVSEEVAGLNFGFTPKRLPTGRRTAATLDLAAEVEPGVGITPGLSTMTFDLDRAIAFEPRGLPVCSWPAVQHHLQVEATGPGDCPRALVGHGEAEFEFTFPEDMPVKVHAPVKIYNGATVGGTPELLIEIPVAWPFEGTIRLVAPIRRLRREPAGTEMTIGIPALDGGYGTLLALHLELGRSFRYEGRQTGFVTASCRRGKLTAVLTATLTDGTSAAEESIRACTP